MRENNCETELPAHVWRAGFLPLAARIRFLPAPARQVWARTAPTTSRSKVQVLRRSALLATARMSAPTCVLWDEMRIAHGDCAERACATSRSKLMIFAQGRGIACELRYGQLDRRKNSTTNRLVETGFDTAIRLLDHVGHETVSALTFLFSSTGS